MKIFKVLFILSFSFLIAIIVSCCDCPITTYYHYTNKSVTVTNLDNSGAGAVETDSSAIIKSAFGIRVKIVAEKTACLKKHDSFLIEGAYAQDCFCDPEFQFNPKDSITGIKISTFNDFDNTHLAGSDVSAYFKIYLGYQYSGISEYIQTLQTEFYSEESLFNNFDMLLMTVPSLGLQHQFKLEITLSDGRIFDVDTKPVDLK